MEIAEVGVAGLELGEMAAVGLEIFEQELELLHQFQLLEGVVFS